MMALAQHAPRLGRRTLIRGIAGGATWGLSVSTALLAFTFYQCGTICLGQIVETTALSVTAGILTIGPIVLLRREAVAAIR